jgi:hypothetical protein
MRPSLSKTVKNIQFTDRKNIPPGLPGEIMKTLLNGPLNVERISKKQCKPVSEILSALTMLELEGIVTQKPGKVFEII